MNLAEEDQGIQEIEVFEDSSVLLRTVLTRNMVEDLILAMYI